MAATTHLHSYGVIAANLGSPATVSQSPSRKLPRNGSGLTRSTRVSRSYTRSCYVKIDRLSDYSRYSSRQKNNLATTLTDPKLTKKAYFSDYLREENLIVLVRPSPRAAVEPRGAEPPSAADLAPAEVPRPPALEPHRIQDSTGESTPTLKPTIIQDDDRDLLVAELSDFSVKIHLTYDEDENSVLVALQVGEQVMEWTRDSIIKPHNNIPQETLLSIDLSRCLMNTLIARQTRTFEDPNYVCDEVTQLCEARDCLIDHIVQQMTMHNRYHTYKKDARDSQNFINYILGSLKVENLPKVSSSLNEYITEVRDSSSALPRFNHVELDNYVKEHLEDMSGGMIEYMALLYYQHHLDCRATADNAGSEIWRCPADQCQVTKLLLKLTH